MKFKPLLLFVFLLALFFGCKSSERQQASNYRDAFIESFKTVSFCRCVELGNNKNLDLDEDDVSCRYPDWLYSEGDVIDSLVFAEVRKIKLDSIDRAQHSVAEGMEGKHVMSYCLKFYLSKELGAVAKRRFK